MILFSRYFLKSLHIHLPIGKKIGTETFTDCEFMEDLYFFLFTNLDPPNFLYVYKELGRRMKEGEEACARVPASEKSGRDSTCFSFAV